LAEAGKHAFQAMAEAGAGDVVAIACDLRRGLTDAGLRALAAEIVHASAAAPERLMEIYDAAAAGWLGRNVAPTRPTPAQDPLPITAAWWRTFWTICDPPSGVGRQTYAQQMMELAGELDARINPRMAAAALAFPGVPEAAGQSIAPPYDVERLAQFSRATLGYALSEELVGPGSPASDPYWTSVIPYLRHMPTPLNHINVHVIQAMPLWALVAGYSLRALDRVALGAFLLGQVGHHYSALATAVTLTTAAVKRPDNLEVVLGCIFKGWTHGRETRPLVLVDWEPLWALPIDQVRQALGVTPFHAPQAGGRRPASRWTPRLV
jgi:ubiquinone biosynthesis protein Coq4